jgi:hypothetical protein
MRVKTMCQRAELAWRSPRRLIPVTLLLVTRGVKGRDAAKLGEGRLVLQALRIVVGGHDVWSCGLQDGQVGVACPLEERTQVVAVGVEGPATVASQKGRTGDR